MDNNQAWQQAGTTWEGMDFSPIPTGDYNVIIHEAKKDTTNSGKGYIGFGFSVIEGEFKNRKVFKTLWVQSTNEKYVQDCYSFVKSCFLLLGVPLPATLPTDQDLAQLTNKPFTAKIVKKKGTDKDGNVIDENEVVKMEALKTVVASNNAVTAPSAPTETNDIPF